MPQRADEITTTGQAGTDLLRARPGTRLSFSVTGMWTGTVSAQTRDFNTQGNWASLAATTVNGEFSFVANEHVDVRLLANPTSGTVTARIGRA